MLTFKKLLLLVTEGSDPGPALARAIHLAGAVAGTLTVLGILDPLPADTPDAGESAEALRRAVAREREQLQLKVNALAATAREAGVTVEARTATGLPLQVAIRTAVADGYDLVLKTVDDREAGSRATRGPLDKDLLRQCPVPLWLEQPGAAAALRRILVAINPDPAEPEEYRLSIDLLQSAAAVASISAAELHVVHAWKLFGEWRSVYNRWTDPELAPLLGATLNRHVGYVERAISEAGLATAGVRQHVVHQRASHAIIETVRGEAVDLLILGTVGRTGIPGFVIGNTAERVLAELDCPVLARKPRGFVSPVLA
jgi:nucleotide-binding universal stress UspA family protein